MRFDCGELGVVNLPILIKERGGGTVAFITGVTAVAM